MMSDTEEARDKERRVYSKVDNTIVEARVE